MGSFSRAFALEPTGGYRSAVKSLNSLLDGIETSSEWDNVREWIAICLENIGENAEAGFWYETTRQLALASDSSLAARDVSQTLSFIQRASESYSRYGIEGDMATTMTRQICVV